MSSNQRTRMAAVLRARTNMAERQIETWQPRSHAFAERGVRAWMGAVRRFLDLQSGSLWKDLSAELPTVRGTVLDMGAGAQPFRQLFDRSVQYIAVDRAGAKEHFNYEVAETLYYDGSSWPVEDGSADFILCTETLEHVYDTRQFLSEARRCLARGGRVLFTVPFGARWHYIPYDYWRFTPSSLRMLFTEAGFKKVEVYARGNQITVACYKVMALILPLLMPQRKSVVVAMALRLVGCLFVPAFFLLAVCGNLSLRGRGGDDCLGYTVLAEGNDPH